MALGAKNRGVESHPTRVCESGLGRKTRLGAVVLFQYVHVSMYKNISALFACSAVKDSVFTWTPKHPRSIRGVVSRVGHAFIDRGSRSPRRRINAFALPFDVPEGCNLC